MDAVQQDTDNVSKPSRTADDGFLRVSGGSDTQSVASAISHASATSSTVKVRAVGAAAVNQAVKAIAISRGHVAQRGLDLVCRPGFTTVDSREGPISAIVFYLAVV